MNGKIDKRKPTVGVGWMEFVMNLTKSEMDNIREMLVDIQLALSSSHNTITTDDVNAQPDSTHWRIDHVNPVKQIDEIARLLNINLYNSPRCTHGSSDL